MFFRVTRAGRHQYVQMPAVTVMAAKLKQQPCCLGALAAPVLEPRRFSGRSPRQAEQVKCVEWLSGRARPP